MKRNNVLNINMIDIISLFHIYYLYVDTGCCHVVVVPYLHVALHYNIVNTTGDDVDGYFIILDKSNLNLLQNWNISRWI